MKQIPLHGKYGNYKYALVDDADYLKFGKMRWIVTPLGYVSNNRQYLHRLILGLTDSKQFTDHINLDKLDNRRENLRICASHQNAVNKPKNKNNTSGFKGVTLWKQNGKWKAQIRRGAKNIHIGYFWTKEEAAKAYDKMAKKLYGEFALLNYKNI